MKVKEKAIAIPEYFMTKLGYYSVLTANERGELIESIAKQALISLGYGFDSLKNKQNQYYLGDLVLVNSKNKGNFIDIKASHSFNGLDKIALDYKYYKNNSEEAYIPNNADSNEGYIHHLNADSLICINPNSKKLYIVNEFQTLRKNVLKLIDDRGCTTSSLLEVSTNRLDPFKDTKIINIAFEDMEQLGAKVIQYKLEKEEKQKDLSDSNTQV